MRILALHCDEETELNAAAIAGMWRTRDRTIAKANKQTEVRDKALREYYDRHSTLQAGEAIRPVARSFPKPRRLVALRLEEETVSAIKHIAAQKGLNYSTLMRMWLTERLVRERR